MQTTGAKGKYNALPFCQNYSTTTAASRSDISPDEQTIELRPEEDLISLNALGYALRIDPARVRRWVENGTLHPDVSQASGERSSYYFRCDRIEQIRRTLGLENIPASSDEWKQEFLDFARSRNLSKSYKPVMIRAFFKLVDREGKVKIDDLVREFRNYYIQRVNAGQPLEIDSSLMARPTTASDHAVKRLIITNPLERFLIKNFMQYLPDVGTLMFGLLDIESKAQATKFTPSFRSLFSYFVRRQSIGSEFAAARQRIKTREERMPAISERRAKIMAILQSHGALDQLTRLQLELAEQEAKTELIRQRFVAAEQLEGLKSELEFERNQLELRLRRDYHEQANLLSDAILAFGKISSALYEEAGNFTIDATPNSPQFEVTVRGEKSKGISNMQIFCFDMMLMRLCTERHIGPGFLVHDSHIFDGVDERQIAKALQIGESLARELNFQYIVTMNSDAVPKELPDGFELNEYILPVHLTDATESSGLFGIRF